MKPLTEQEEVMLDEVRKVLAITMVVIVWFVVAFEWYIFN